jgi:hypothetical protein
MSDQYLKPSKAFGFKIFYPLFFLNYSRGDAHRLLTEGPAPTFVPNYQAVKLEYIHYIYLGKVLWVSISACYEKPKYT